MQYKSFLIAPVVWTSFGLLPSHGQALTGENARDISRVIAPSEPQAKAYDLKKVFAADKVEALSKPPLDASAAFDLWHRHTLEILAADHVPRPDGQGGEKNLRQFGPHRASYVTALVHLAMFEVANRYAATPRFNSWIEKRARPGTPDPGRPVSGSSESAAIVEAAYVMLRSLYDNFDTELRGEAADAKLDGTPDAIAAGRDFGRRIALTLIDLRAEDGHTIPEPRIGQDPDFPVLVARADAGAWSFDPVSKVMVALGGKWGRVTPFVADHTTIDLAEADMRPPSVDTNYYQQAADEVERDGVDPFHPVSVKTRDNTYHYYQGKFWSYDGTPSLCAPVRLYNQIADVVFHDHASEIAPSLASNPTDGIAEKARFYALANLAMADAGIEAWKLKYRHRFWRPVTGIRAQLSRRQSTMPKAPEPTAETNPFPDAKHLPTWFPLGAQNSNAQVGYNVTPPFPAYPSGHAVFGSAFFEVLRQYPIADQTFSFQSDELDAKKGNVDVYNYVRCSQGDTNKYFCKAVTFKNFANAERCNSLSRIWLGVHWSFDADDGQTLGRVIGRAAMSELGPSGAPASLRPEEPTLGTCEVPTEFSLDAMTSPVKPPSVAIKDEAPHLSTDAASR